MAEDSDTQYAESAGLSIAYRTVGHGPLAGLVRLGLR